ncbi:type IV secretory system conjugative DNA transfer family protein [Nitrosomonas sp.]|uniref:type IV secretory system conjugative DNA transfer family protein n=1 Tax=Nitrosomonas sp. TaxID=42353 RepID=UPI002851D24E|nr:type IV secretory system conjugative DNA transfer family protein [Nitrosomonas sp.]MDR4515743.1 type IV secretory system conjugative DNA transfer family protein [Nitrosomonas sp.]
MSHNSPPIMRHAVGSLLGKGVFFGIGLWAWSAFPHYWFVGAGLMGMAVFSMISPVYHIGVATKHRKQQRQWSYEAKEKIFGKTARLAQAGDDVINRLRGRSGLFLGALGKELLFYNPWQPSAGHLTCLAPARSGKSSLLIGTLLNKRNLIGKLRFSAWINDCKGELYFLAAPLLEKMGKRVLALNPFGLPGIRQDHWNPLDVVTDSVILKDGEARDWAHIIAQALIPEPEGQGGISDNSFFREGGRQFLMTLILYMAVFMPFQCNLVRLRELVNTTEDRLLVITNQMRESDSLNGLIRSNGEKLTDNLKAANQKTFGSFRQEAEHAVDIYDPNSDFGRSVLRSDFKLADILDQNTFLFDVTPAAKLGTHGRHKALVSTLLIETVARQTKRSNFLMLFDEIGNMGKLPTTTMTKALALLPGLGLRLAMYWQSMNQMSQVYGQDLMKLFLDQSSIIQVWGVRSPDMAKEFSRRSGSTTRKKQSFSKDPLERDYSMRKNWDEKEEPVLSETEILHLPSDEQLISISGQPMIRARRISFWKIRDWRQSAGVNPSEPGGYPKNDRVEWDY